MGHMTKREVASHKVSPRHKRVGMLTRSTAPTSGDANTSTAPTKPELEPKSARYLPP